MPSSGAIFFYVLNIFCRLIVMWVAEPETTLPLPIETIEDPYAEEAFQSTIDFWPGVLGIWKWSKWEHIDFTKSNRNEMPFSSLALFFFFLRFLWKLKCTNAKFLDNRIRHYMCEAKASLFKFCGKMLPSLLQSISIGSSFAHHHT